MFAFEIASLVVSTKLVMQFQMQTLFVLCNIPLHKLFNFPLTFEKLMYIELTYDSLFPGPSGFYVLENLQPTTTYDLRFASKNLVGFSEWGAGKQLTMPQRGPPEKPRINTMVTHALFQDLCTWKSCNFVSTVTTA